MISTTLQIAMIVAIVVYFAIIIALLKRGSLSLKYSLMWMLAGVVMLVLALFPMLLTLFSRAFGFTLPVNALFTVMFFFVILILMALTSIATKLSSNIKELTQHQALLEQRIRELENK